jgi:RNA polymerase sigma-B factor
VLEGLQTVEAYDAVSLDAPLQGDDGVTSRLDSIGGEGDRFELVEEQAAISIAAKNLPRRERQILLLRFHEDLTQSEIAGLIGVSQMHVSRLLRNSLRRLRKLTDDRPGA